MTNEGEKRKTLRWRRCPYSARELHRLEDLECLEVEVWRRDAGTWVGRISERSSRDFDTKLQAMTWCRVEAKRHLMRDLKTMRVTANELAQLHSLAEVLPC